MCVWESVYARVAGGMCVRQSVCVCVCMHGGKAFGSHSLISMWPLPGGESSLLARCVCGCASV